MTLDNVPPHLQNEKVAVCKNKVILNMNKSVQATHYAKAQSCHLQALWPLLTDDERRLMVGASLMTTRGKTMIGTHEVLTWRDGEIWIDLPPVHNKVKEAVRLQRKRAMEVKRAANT